MLTLKRFEDIAREYVNGEANSLESIERKLIAWFCFTFNTTPNDDRLLNMTIEELLVLYHMHLFKNSPELTHLKEDGEKDDYEEWLQQEMGDDYISEEDMVKLAEAEEENAKKIYDKIKDKLPEKITTDFSSLREE